MLHDQAEQYTCGCKEDMNSKEETGWERGEPKTGWTFTSDSEDFIISGWHSKGLLASLWENAPNYLSWVGFRDRVTSHPADGIPY